MHYDCILVDDEAELAQASTQFCSFISLRLQ